MMSELIDLKNCKEIAVANGEKYIGTFSKSGWVVEFTDGQKIILDEYNYKIYDKINKKPVICEIHYFDISNAFKRHKGIQDIYIKNSGSELNGGSKI